MEQFAYHLQQEHPIVFMVPRAGITGYTNLLRHEPVKVKHEHDLLAYRVIFLKHEHDTKINRLTC